jgi:subtilase family protein
MQSKVLCVLLGVALGSTLPGAAATTQKPPFHKETQNNALSPLYIEKRYVGLLKTGRQSCPEVPGWHAEKLLDEAFRPAGRKTWEREQEEQPTLPYAAAALPPKAIADRQAADPTLLHELGLDKFCVYTASGTAGAFAKPPGLIKAARDRMGLSAAGHVPSLGKIGDQIWPTLADEYVRQLGKVQFSKTATPAVRLVFIDTQPTGEGLPERPSRSWHGYSMAHLARQLLCGDPATPCAVQFATRLALRYDYYNKDMIFSPDDPGKDAGGSLGRISDLATAIVAEVDHWRRQDPDKKLILNLSVGWDGELHEAGRKADLDIRKASKLDPASLAVYKALRYARRRGALVIAAAGNRRGGPEESTWPLLPAAWELRRPSWLPFGLGPKRVYAVGGIDWQGLPLSISRFGGKPRRVAYGDHAVARIAEDESTRIYTGTSVSTAVVSAIAAALWQLRPELRPGGVMRRMARSGEPLDSRADFYAWKPLAKLIGPPHLRRMSLCRSVLAVCGPDGATCPALETIDCQLWKHPFTDLSWIQRPPAIDCKDGGQTAESPVQKYPGLWSLPAIVGTQPPENPCQSCTIVPDPPTAGSAGAPTSSSASYDLLVSIDPKWADNPNTPDPPEQGNIETATLVYKCTGMADDLIPFDPSDVSLLNPAPDYIVSFNVRSPQGKDSLAGCVVSLDFSVKLDGATEPVSVQSSVKVDP